MLRKRYAFAGQALTAFVVAGLLVVASPVSAATVQVRAGGESGWFYQPDSCAVGATSGSQVFEAGPGTTPLGIGSLEQRVGSNGQSRQSIGQMNWSGTALSAITDLRYSTYVDQPGSAGQAPYVILNVDHNSDSVVDDHLFFEPAYQNTSVTGLPVQGPVFGATWQAWNAGQGGWWSEKGIAGATSGNGVKSLQAYLAVQPSSRIINNSVDNTAALRISSGCGSSWTSFVGNVDNVTLASNVFASGATTTTTNTYDFEPQLTPGAVLACSPSSTTVTVGQPVTLSATGGTGIYMWSAPGLTISNPSGTQFTATYGGSGISTVTVTSGAQTASCTVTVLPLAGTPPTVPPTIPPVIPGLPNTGEGGLVGMTLLALALAGVAGLGAAYSIRRTI